MNDPKNLKAGQASAAVTGYTAAQALTLDSIAATFEADADRMEICGLKARLYQCAMKAASLSEVYRGRMKQCNGTGEPQPPEPVSQHQTKS